MPGNGAKLVVSNLVRSLGGRKSWPDISPSGDLKIVIVSGKGDPPDQIESCSFAITMTYGRPDWTGLVQPALPTVYEYQMGDLIHETDPL